MILSDEIIAYAEAHTTSEPLLLAKLNRETHLSQVHPQMLSGNLQGTLLRMICQMIRPLRVLEIGTFTGYSALAMALGMSQLKEVASHARLHTIEINPELEEGIRRYIKESGMEEKIILHIGAALEVIAGLNEKWDLVFIDADKPNYLNYYQAVLPDVTPGGFILADNVLWDGKVVGDPGRMDKDTRGIIAFNDFVAQDPQVETLMLPVRDGLMLIRKIN